MGCDVPGANCEVVIKKPIPNIQYEVDWLNALYGGTEPTTTQDNDTITIKWIDGTQSGGTLWTTCMPITLTAPQYATWSTTINLYVIWE
jgi:hypothetical protein